MPEEPTVFVVDDDPGIRKSTSLLIKSVQLPIETFESAEEFFEGVDPDRPGCLVLDLRMPGMSGLELQERLVAGGFTLPVIFISAHGDVATAVRAMRAGAIEFLEKPYRGQDLLDRIHEAIAMDGRERASRAERATVTHLIDSLTPREHEVMDLIVEGTPNKAIASQLGISRKTVDVHRVRIMRKMKASCVADLVRKALSASFQFA
jgi:RNA polymerase sigma factor (sigma-70 family)